MRKVDTKAVMTVKTKFAILLIVSRFIKLKFLKLKMFFMRRALPCRIIFLTFFGAKKEAKKHPPNPSPSLYGRGVTDYGGKPPCVRVFGMAHKV